MNFSLKLENKQVAKSSVVHINLAPVAHAQGVTLPVDSGWFTR
ncbi:MAG: hypothetical protein ACRBEQ_10095 [Hyphomonas sp.]